ncbi:MAG: hypothetical protein IJ271_02050 [Bacteroidales bacterium]|nr:hypothetical protein [Bacteroidales bacterium]
MKKKIFALVMAVMMLAMMLTGCIQNDIGVKMNKDGTGSISATIGIEKDFYQNLKQMGSDPFEDKTTTEYTYEDSTYVAYTEVKEYSSYEEMEKALLEMTYDTELIEDAQEAQDAEMNGDNEDFDGNGDDVIVLPDYEEPEAPEKDNHIFSSVNIEKNSGIFYSSYTFNAVMNPQSNDGLDYDMNEAFKVTLTVEMPEEITQSKGGKVEGNKITFDIADVTESQEFAATCESNNTGVVIGIVIGLVVIVAGIFCFIKFKK